VLREGRAVRGPIGRTPTLSYRAGVPGARTPRIQLTLGGAAAATAALLVVDAWFDCMTTPGDARWESIAFCCLVELPLAAVCVWLSYHTEQVSQQRILILQRQLWPFRRLAGTSRRRSA